jgi:hypothetical protein
MRRTLSNLALALAIFIVGIGLVVGLTEYQIARSSPANQHLLAHDDVTTALGDQGLAVEATQRIATHPALRATGRALRVDGIIVEVYLYPTVVDRVRDEQALLEHERVLNRLRDGGPAAIHITSARNALIRIAPGESTVFRQILAAVRALARDEG